MIRQSHGSSARKMKARAYYSSQPWRCEMRGGDCAIVAYVDRSAQWETIAVVQPPSDIKAKALGDFIVSLVNEWHRDGDLLQAAFKALDGVLREGMNFTTEQDAEHVVEALKQRGF